LTLSFFRSKLAPVQEVSRTVPSCEGHDLPHLIRMNVFYLPTAPLPVFLLRILSLGFIPSPPRLFSFTSRNLSLSFLYLPFFAFRSFFSLILRLVRSLLFLKISDFTWLATLRSPPFFPIILFLVHTKPQSRPGAHLFRSFNLPCIFSRIARLTANLARP